MLKDQPLSYCADRLRQFDRDRYLTALFAPRERRDALFVLYAFNLEIARIAEATTEPLIGEMRLQWWRDVIAEAYGGKALHGNVVAKSLGEVIATHRLTRSYFDRLLEARAFDPERRPPDSLEELKAYAEATSGGLQCLALEILGVGENPDAARAAYAVGVAWALTGLLRAVPFHGRAGRRYLPVDLIAATGIAPEALPLGQSTSAMAAVAKSLAEAARSALRQARQGKRNMPGEALPALMLGALADRYLARIAKADYDLFDSNVAASPPLREVGLWLRARKGNY